MVLMMVMVVVVRGLCWGRVAKMVGGVGVIHSTSTSIFEQSSSVFYPKETCKLIKYRPNIYSVNTALTQTHIHTYTDSSGGDTTPNTDETMNKLPGLQNAFCYAVRFVREYDKNIKPSSLSQNRDHFVAKHCSVHSAAQQS